MYLKFKGKSRWEHSNSTLHITFHVFFKVLETHQTRVLSCLFLCIHKKVFILTNITDKQNLAICMDLFCDYNVIFFQAVK